MKDSAGDRNIYIRTMGGFEVFVDDYPIHFRSSKSKELLALLVCKGGCSLSIEEAIRYLWPEEVVNNKTKTKLRRTYCRLNSTLDEKGIGDVVEGYRGFKYLRMDKLSCDFEYRPKEKDTGIPGNPMKERFMKEYWWRREFLEVPYAKRE